MQDNIISMHENEGYPAIAIFGSKMFPFTWSTCFPL